MTKRKLIYDPEKNYELADFQNTTIKNLYAIGKKIGIRDVKKPKKNVLAQLILEKHNNAFVEEKQKIVTSILDEIIDNVMEKCEPEPKECSLLQMKEDFNKITFFQVKNDIFFHGNEVAKYLEYSNYADAIYKIVNCEDKVNFHELKTVLGLCESQRPGNNIVLGLSESNTNNIVLGLSESDRVQFQAETIFINQDGLNHEISNATCTPIPKMAIS